MELRNDAVAVRPWHAISADALALDLRTHPEAGLGADEAGRRQQSEGFNELPEAPPPSLVKLFLSQFTSVIVWVLIGAAVISGLLEDWVDAAAILAIVLLNGVLGFVQEFRAERSLAALRKMTVATARVFRDGILQSIPARELVPGDLILLEAGDRIPADARLIYTTNFQTQEASLTGESTPVEKSVDVLSQTDLPLAERTNMVFMGTVAVSGKARAVVVATALRTELGRIAAMIQKATEAERAETPLQRRLEQFGYTLLWLALGVVTVVFLLGYLRGEPAVLMLLTAVSLAVAAVPEGLPAVVTITLALGVTRMVKRHALIRKLPAVETLGSATVICSDKTGTLTKNEMTVTRLFAGDLVFEVTGEGYEPVGEIREKSSELKVLSSELSGRTPRLENPEFRTQNSEPSQSPALRDLLTGGSALQRCNAATRGRNVAYSRRSDGRRTAGCGGEGISHDRKTRFDLSLSRRGAVRSGAQDDDDRSADTGRPGRIRQRRAGCVIAALYASAGHGWHDRTPHGIDSRRHSRRECIVRPSGVARAGDGPAAIGSGA